MRCVTAVCRLVLPMMLVMPTSSHLRAQSVDPPCFVDEALKDSSLVGFRERLTAAVRGRDLQALRSLLAPDVRLHIPNIWAEVDVKGIAAFEREFARSPVSWINLERTLGYPGRLLESSRFCAPYFICASGWSLTFVQVLEPNVPAMSGPTAGSAVVERVSCKELRSVDETTPPEPYSSDEWTPVLLERGWAYISNRFLAIKADSFAVEIRKRDGRWLLTAFVGAERS